MLDEQIFGAISLDVFNTPHVTIGFHDRALHPDCPKGWYCIVTKVRDRDGQLSELNTLEVIHRGATSPNEAFENAMNKFIFMLEQESEYERNAA